MNIRTSGFTLLEAVVALAILSTSGIALYAWLSTSLAGLIRVNETLQVNEVMADLDAYFSTLNLQSETEQVFRINGYDIYWQATLVEPIQAGWRGVNEPSYFDLGLYDVDVKIHKGTDQLGEYKTRLVGYEAVRSPTGPIQ